MGSFRTKFIAQRMRTRTIFRTTLLSNHVSLQVLQARVVRAQPEVLLVHPVKLSKLSLKIHLSSFDRYDCRYLLASISTEFDDWTNEAVKNVMEYLPQSYWLIRVQDQKILQVYFSWPSYVLLYFYYETIIHWSSPVFYLVI